MTKLICDCCGKEIVPPEMRITFHFQDAMETVFQDGDVCKLCADKFFSMLNTEEINND